jgi:NADP-dependent 3-hydroxy acid dehydrogenase YdfG
VLEYSPLPRKEFLRPVLETTVDDLVAAIEFSVLGPVAAVHQVLPGMRSLGRGSILFVNGGSGARPNPNDAGTSIAFDLTALPN